MSNLGAARKPILERKTSLRRFGVEKGGGTPIIWVVSL